MSKNSASVSVLTFSVLIVLGYENYICNMKLKKRLSITLSSGESVEEWTARDIGDCALNTMYKIHRSVLSLHSEWQEEIPCFQRSHGQTVETWERHSVGQQHHRYNQGRHF